ncbi:MAG: conserved membrane protein of unknown function [Promethearchaeota archaeon]|nr:MAG: conserved membrane protein of unknown function [Candidatus Lokiarchaeota archaeon]
MMKHLKFINNWDSLGFIFAMIAPIQYFIVGLISMCFYPGGTLYDATSPGFYIWGNYFSDLGRTIALSGESNLISFIIFTPAALIFSVSFIPFIFLMPKFFEVDENQHKIALAGSFAGIFAAGFLILTILTPWDIFGNIHMLFATLFNLSGSIFAFFYFIAVMKNKEFPNIYGYAYLFLLIAAVIYIILTFSTSLLPVSDKVIIQASYQKLSQYSFLFCYFLQSYKGYRLSLEKCG